MSEAVKSKWNDPEYQQKMSEIRKGRTTWMKGKHHSYESKKKLSEASKSKWNEPEYRERILESKKNISDETRRKIGEAGKGRSPWNKGLTGLSTGRKVSEEVKQRISQANKGKKHSEESRRKNSEAVKLAWQNPEYRKRISEFNKGKKLSEETRKKISEALKGALKNPEIRKKLAERRKYQKFPQSDSIPEKMIQEALRAENIEFTKHKPFKIGNSYHQVDIFIEPNICIEIDGHYWHNRLGAKQRDAQIDDSLKSQGYYVVRVIAPHKNRDFDVKPHVETIKELIQQISNKSQR